MSEAGKKVLHELTTGNIEARVGRAVDKAHYFKDRSLLQTEVYIRKNPIQAVGYAAGIGFAVGVLVSSILLTSTQSSKD
ncbi:MAG: DUF883 C-terminal domain-containing protein [Verrucomicrobiota bacterium]